MSGDEKADELEGTVLLVECWSDGAVMQRLRLTFAHGEPLRWISHLDVVRLWERALRRAGLPVAYTRGYNPQLRIQFAAALPTGCFGRAEVADLWMERAMPPQEVASRIRAELPSGIELLDVQEVDIHLPSLQSLLRAADWRVAVDAADLPWEELERRVLRILAADRIPRDRRRWLEQSAQRYDLRPLIEALWLEGRDRDDWPVLRMRLRAEPGATGRPDEVLDALGLGQRPSRMERIALHFAEPEVRPAEHGACPSSLHHWVAQRPDPLDLDGDDIPVH